MRTNTASPTAWPTLARSETCCGRRCGIGSQDRKSTRLNSSHQIISYAVFCLKKKKQDKRVGNDFYIAYLDSLHIRDLLNDSRRFACVNNFSSLIPRHIHPSSSPNQPHTTCAC